MARIYDVIINDTHVYVKATNVDYAIADAESQLINMDELGKRGINEPGTSLTWRILREL